MAKTSSTAKVRKLQEAPILFPTDLGEKASKDISAAMDSILADVFALYLKTKNFHWHVSGPHFRDYHLMFDDQGAELFAMTDPIAERVRKLGVPHYVQSVISQDYNELKIMMLILSNLLIC